MSVPRQAVITARNGDWATLRVRGLLGNAALAARLASAAGDGLQIRPDTGSVRVRLFMRKEDAFGNVQTYFTEAVVALKNGQ